MKLLYLTIFFLAIMVSTSYASELGDYYVNAPVLNERTAPTTGKIANRIYKGQKVTVYSTQGLWAQISSPGYEQRWVNMKYLTREKPELPKAKDIVTSGLLSGQKHRDFSRHFQRVQINQCARS